MKKRFDDIIIVSDIDGTFLGSDPSAARKNIEAVKYFKENGGRFTVATGRIYMHVISALGEDDRDLCNAPMTIANGARICSPDGEELSTVYMDTDALVRHARYIRDNFPTLGMRCSTSDGIVTDKVFGLIAKDVKVFAGGRVEVKEIEDWRDERIFKLVVRGEAGDLERLKDAALPMLEKDFYCTSSSTRFFEVNAMGCTKARGIKYLRECYPNAKIYAVGDYGNDIEMMKAADVAACPSGALDDVKNICDLKLCSCDDGAIAYLIERFL